MSRSIQIRIHIETDNMQVGKEAYQFISTQISSVAQAIYQDCQQYWKIPEQMVVTMSIHSNDAASQVDLPGIFDTLLQQLGTGWQCGGPADERWAIWNPSPTNEFAIKDTRWAILEMISAPALCN